MATEYYGMDAGLAPLNPQQVTVTSSLPTNDVVVAVLTSGATGVINKMQVRLILENILQLIESKGVGTAYQTDQVPIINP